MIDILTEKQKMAIVRKATKLALTGQKPSLDEYILLANGKVARVKK